MLTSAVKRAAAAKRAAKAEKVEKIDDPFKEALITQTCTNNRRQVLNVLNKAKFLYAIPLGAVPIGDVEAAEKEVAADRVMLNGLQFLGTPEKPSDVLAMLREVCQKLCDPGHSRAGRAPFVASDGSHPSSVVIDPRDLYECILFRMSRAANAAGAYLKLNEMVGTPDLTVMPRKEEHTKLPHVDVEVFVSSSPGSLGSVHTAVSCPNVYGLFRKVDLKQQFGRKVPKPHDVGNSPWIPIDAFVEERTSFATGDYVRYLRVKALDGLRF